jgi:DNA-directed RNA polymerase subunit RPC12/RpoP
MTIENTPTIKCDNCGLTEPISPEHGPREVLQEGWRDIVFTRFAMEDDQSQRENLCPGCMEAVRIGLAAVVNPLIPVSPPPERKVPVPRMWGRRE